MKKAFATAMIALAMTGASATPAMAGDTRETDHKQWIDLNSMNFVVETYVELVGLLLPVVQAAREAA